jgi:hypothetical protein
MSFLPFVLSFLLILVIGSSFLFTSFRSTSLEKTVILAQHRAHLSLLSKQAEQQCKPQRKETPTSDPKIESKEPKETKDKAPVYKDKRNKRCGLDSSKFNLWPLFHPKDNVANAALRKSAIRLIQILYQDAEFYKKAHDPKLAENILDGMLSKKGEDLSHLFPEEELGKVYYKMLKGTNTGYPPLGEYFKIEKTDNPPVRWSYATTSILRAILGDDATNRVLAAEKASWEENHHTRILPEEKLRTLLKNQTNFDINNLKTFFWFNKKGKGTRHTYVEKQSKVTATK